MLEAFRTEGLKMLNKDQRQSVGSDGIGIQAGGNVNIGISVEEARSIALDVAKVTFYELTGLAKDTMSARVEEITEHVISRISKEYPEGLRKAVDPDFQYALLTVQKQYGRTGDEDLGQLLADLLVDRSKQDQRSILQIVLNESLEVAPKLTASQLSILAVAFFLRYTVENKMASDAQLGLYFDVYLQPFVSGLVNSIASFQHLEFAGCGSAQMAHASLEDIFLHGYTGLFVKGFDAAVVEASGLSDSLCRKFLIPCLNDKTKFQVGAMNLEVLQKLIGLEEVAPQDAVMIFSLFGRNKMSASEVRSKCVALRSYMERVFTFWDESDIHKFSLTSVGIAIGHANIKKTIGKEFADLSIWIN